MNSSPSAPPLPPVTVLTGFLGSGKTTLLRRALQSPASSGVALLINELGTVSIDDRIVGEVREDTVVLSSGCVCCTVRNDLVRALCDLHLQAARAQIPPLRAVVLETTGLADPTPVVATLARHGLVRTLFRLGPVVSTVDALAAESTWRRHPEALKQVQLADRLVITKCDRSTASDIARLRELLPGTNPLARILRSDDADPLATLLAPVEHTTGRGAIHDAEGAPGDASPHDAGGGVRAFALVAERAVSFASVAAWMSAVAQTSGGRVLRMKGVLHVDDDELPVVVQSVQDVVFPVTSLPAWHRDGRHSRMVVITRGMSPLETTALRQGLTGVLGPTARVIPYGF